MILATTIARATPWRRATQAAPERQLRYGAVPMEAVWEADLLQSLALGGGAAGNLVSRLRRDGRIRAETAAWRDGGMIGHLAAADLAAPSGWVVLLPAAVSADAGAMTQSVRQGLVRALLPRLAAAGARAAVSRGDPALHLACGFRYGIAAADEHAATTGIYDLTAGGARPGRPDRIAGAIAYPEAMLTV